MKNDLFIDFTYKVYVGKLERNKLIIISFPNKLYFKNVHIYRNGELHVKTLLSELMINIDVICMHHEETINMPT